MTWERIDGTLLGLDLRGQVAEIEGYFAGHGMLAVLDFHPDAAQTLALRLLADEEDRVATLAGDAVVAGLELEELVADIAQRFDVDVFIGDYSLAEESDGDEPGDDSDTEVDAEVDDAVGAAGHEHHDDHEHADHEHEDDHAEMRAVTILDWEPERAHALARAAGVPLRVSQAHGRLVVLTSPGEEMPEVLTWKEGRLPAVQLLADGPVRTVVGVRDNESAAVMTWGATRSVLPQDAGGEAADLLATLASDATDLDVIGAVDPEADPAEVAAAMRLGAGAGPARLLAAFGLGEQYARFLDGELAGAAVPGSEVVEHVSAVRVVRERIADAAEKPAQTGVMELLDRLERDWPVPVRAVSVGVGALGACLLVRSARSRPARPALAVTGAWLVAEACGELAFYTWLRRRRDRESVTPTPAG